MPPGEEGGPQPLSPPFLRKILRPKDLSHRGYLAITAASAGRRTPREKRALRRAEIRRGNSLREGEIDAIVTVIEMDIISITIIIISTIITAVSTAGHRHRRSNLGIAMDEVRKKLFSISLSGKAAHWYKLLDNGDSLEWNDIVPRFYSKFYPPNKTLLDTSCSGSFTRNKEEFKRDLLNRIQENTEGWEIDKDRESVETVDHVIPEAYIEKTPFPAKMKEYSVINSAVHKSEKKPIEHEEQIKVEPAVAIVKDLVTENVEDGHIIFCEDASNIVSHPNKPKQASVPMLSVRIGDHCYYGLCDIGASISAIPYELYTEIMHEIGSCELEDIDVVIQLANRETISPIGIVRDVEVLCAKGSIGGLSNHGRVLCDHRITRKQQSIRKKKHSSLERRTGRRRRRSRATYTRLVAEAMAWRGSARAATAAAKPGKAPALRRRTPPQQHGTETTQVLQAAPAPAIMANTFPKRTLRKVEGWLGDYDGPITALLCGMLKELHCDPRIPVIKYTYYDGEILAKCRVSVQLPEKLLMSRIMPYGEAKTITTAYHMGLFKAILEIRQHKSVELLCSEFSHIPHAEEDEDPTLNHLVLAHRSPEAAAQHMDSSSYESGYGGDDSRNLNCSESPIENSTGWRFGEPFGDEGEPITCESEDEGGAVNQNVNQSYGQKEKDTNSISLDLEMGLPKTSQYVVGESSGTKKKKKKKMRGQVNRNPPWMTGEDELYSTGDMYESLSSYFGMTDLCLGTSSDSDYIPTGRTFIPDGVRRTDRCTGWTPGMYAEASYDDEE
ncbi:hypothetical protein QYE76_066170 [Lolium multiflorum]|uniref:Retrotransposon gag domain-containing protein n=1 Tax=Lolium multiflorum TaxID=4521 RepID=A0AAD8WAL4_LOLMU|nr:hypothetical protein QYE76_066170 [Lolium multiflorum]